PLCPAADLVHGLEGAAQFVAAHGCRVFTLQPDLGPVFGRQVVVLLQGRRLEEVAQRDLCLADRGGKVSRAFANDLTFPDWQERTGADSPIKTGTMARGRGVLSCSSCDTPRMILFPAEIPLGVICMSDAPKKVVLAYSGGLDTSIILKWLQTEYGCEVIT